METLISPIKFTLYDNSNSKYKKCEVDTGDNYNENNSGFNGYTFLHFLSNQKISAHNNRNFHSQVKILIIEIITIVIVTLIQHIQTE